MKRILVSSPFELIHDKLNEKNIKVHRNSVYEESGKLSNLGKENQKACRVGLEKQTGTP